MKRIIPLIIIIAILGAGYWWYTQPTATALTAGAETGALVGSGTIEADTVAVTAELGGRIIELRVDEGDEVTAGQVLIELDKSDLLALQIQLKAAVSTAKANLEMVSASVRPEDVALAQAQLEQAETGRDGAKLVSDQARSLANNPHELTVRIAQMQGRVTEAERNLESAKVNLKRMEIQAEAANRDWSSNIAQAQNKVAQYQLQAAQQGVEMAKVALAGTKKQVQHLIRLRDRPLALIARANAAEAAFKQAEAGVLAAEANLVAAKADPTPEDVNVARAQLLEAESALAIVQVQLNKQTLAAPRAGLVSQKLVKPGELAAPGAMLLKLSDLETVDLTVYIPETQIGNVQIGQKANVHVDAYEGEIFDGRVSFIAHEAEFTPRNVQTKEERVNLVFGVKITLNNAGHRLKPGMPADAEILMEMWKAEENDQAAAFQPEASETIPTPTATPFSLPTAAPEPTATQANPTATAEPTPSAQAEIIAWSLRVRAGPDVESAAVSHLSQGDVVPIIETDPDTGWLHVQLPEGAETGWITGSETFVLIK